MSSDMAPDTVAAAFLDSVSRYGHRTVVIEPDGEDVTYSELAGRVAEAVSLLSDLGCRAGDRVAIWLPNRLEWPVFQFAAALLGLCIVPVNTRFRPSELEYVLRLSGAKVLVTQSRFLTNDYIGRLHELAGGRLGDGDSASIERLPALERIILLDGGPVSGTIAYQRPSGPNPSVDLEALASGRKPEEPLWLFWTSGTTSDPKGAILAQSAIRNISAWSSMAGYRADDRVLMSRPLFYIAGNYWCMLAPILHGAAMVVGKLFSPREMVDLCRRGRVTVLSGNPLLLKSLVNDAGFEPDAFSHVRFGYFGGSSVSAQDLQMIKERIGFDYLLQTYGMTELEGFATSTQPEDPPEITAATCGYALPGLEMRIVDPTSGLPVAHGQPGLLVTRGRGLQGYIGISDEDRSRLFDSDGWFRTGDLLRERSDGRYEFIGRVKDLIKVGGENVAAAEIEKMLLLHEQIAQAAVIGRSDEKRGEVPIAFVEPRLGRPLDSEVLREWCHQRIAPFKVPAEFIFMSPGDWPTTATGKIAKHELPSDMDGGAA